MTATRYKIVSGREVGYFDGFVIRYWDPEKGLWFDHGDKHDTRAAAAARLAELEDEQALELANSHRRLRIVDHHPWQAPPGRIAIGHRDVDVKLFMWRTVAGVAVFALALDLVGHAASAGGWGRIAYAIAALVVVQLSIRLMLGRQ